MASWNSESELWKLVGLTKGHSLKCGCDNCEKLRQLKRRQMQKFNKFAANADSMTPPPTNTVASSRVSTEASNDPGMQQSASVPVVAEELAQNFRYRFPSDPSSEEAKPSTSGSKPSEEQAKAAELKQSNAASAASKIPPPSNTIASSRVSTEASNDRGMQQSVNIPVIETYKPLDELIDEEIANDFGYGWSINPFDPSSEEAKPSTSGSKPSEEQAEAAELQQSNAASAASKTPPPGNTVASSHVSTETLNDLGMQQSVYIPVQETYKPLNELVAEHFLYQFLPDQSSEEEDKPSTSGNKPSEEQGQAAGWEVVEQKEYDPPKEEFCNLSDLEDALNDVDEVEENRDDLDFDFPDPNPTHN